MSIRRAAAAAGLIATAACAQRTESRPARRPETEAVVVPEAPASRVEVQAGEATWYGGRLAGHRMANGERFDPRRMTAAHRTLPLGTWVEVTREDDGRTVRVQITDRGPFGHPERIIDLSRAAADRLGMVHMGVARVHVRILPGP